MIWLSANMNIIKKSISAANRFTLATGLVSMVVCGF